MGISEGFLEEDISRVLFYGERTLKNVRRWRFYICEPKMVIITWKWHINWKRRLQLWRHYRIIPSLHGHTCYLLFIISHLNTSDKILVYNYLMTILLFFLVTDGKLSHQLESSVKMTPLSSILINGKSFFCYGRPNVFFIERPNLKCLLIELRRKSNWKKISFWFFRSLNKVFF